MGRTSDNSDSLPPEQDRLTDEDIRTLYDVWIASDVNRGIGWVFPAVEAILARHCGDTPT